MTLPQLIQALKDSRPDPQASYLELMVWKRVVIAISENMPTGYGPSFLHEVGYYD